MTHLYSIHSAPVKVPASADAAYTHPIQSTQLSDGAPLLSHAPKKAAGIGELVWNAAKQNPNQMRGMETLTAAAAKAPFVAKVKGVLANGLQPMLPYNELLGRTVKTSQGDFTGYQLLASAHVDDAEAARRQLLELAGLPTSAAPESTTIRTGWELLPQSTADQVSLGLVLAGSIAFPKARVARQLRKLQQQLGQLTESMTNKREALAKGTHTLAKLKEQQAYADGKAIAVGELTGRSGANQSTVSTAYLSNARESQTAGAAVNHQKAALEPLHKKLAAQEQQAAALQVRINHLSKAVTPK